MVIRIGAHELSPEVAFSPEGGASLRDYLRLPPVHYTLLELPLGARLSRDDGCVGTDAEADVAASRFLLRAPPLRVLSLLLVPTVRVAAAVGPDAVVLRVVSATLEGSLAAALAGRFRLTGATTFAASGCGRRVASRTSLLLRVRPPPPFSSLPAAALRRVGEAAVGAMSAALQRVFVAALARDYARWAEAAGGGGGGGGGAGRGAGLVGAAGGGGREEEHQEDEASGGEDERGEGGGAERAGSGGRPV